MNHISPSRTHEDGIQLCVRFAFPPNSLELCGPVNRKTDIASYRIDEHTDTGTEELLSKFKTLYPYLTLIASHNNLKDPFDRNVVEAYWLGNRLLDRVPKKSLATFLSDTLEVKKSLPKQRFTPLMEAVSNSGIPHHSYHVFSVWRRSGHTAEPHTANSIDACIVNWGKIESLTDGNAIVITQRILIHNGRLVFSGPVRKNVMLPTRETFKPGDWIAYHWGIVCCTLNRMQLAGLIHFTKRSLAAANGAILP